jgi:hypothetical protein
MADRYQARLIKRVRRTRAQIEQLESQIYEALRRDHPQSVRHLFYRMTDPRLEEPVEKTERGYSQVQDRITKMRRAGTIPYGWITDATRRGFHVRTFTNASDAIRAWHRAYRADLWQGAGIYIEVWCESRSIAGVIEGTCRDLAVSLYPAGGFTSITLAHQAADHINRATASGVLPAHVIYLGDYDPAGVLIDQSLEKELREHLDPAVDLQFSRIAITPDQIDEMDLPTKPRKRGDRRALHVRSSVEAEAMPAGVMRELVRGTVESFLPPGALEVARAAEESERWRLNWMADQLEALK